MHAPSICATREAERQGEGALWMTVRQWMVNVSLWMEVDERITRYTWSVSHAQQMAVSLRVTQVCTAKGPQKYTDADSQIKQPTTTHTEF